MYPAQHGALSNSRIAVKINSLMFHLPFKRFDNNFIGIAVLIFKRSADAIRKVMNLEEMRRLVRICYAAETKTDALKQLYTVFARERGDVLADAKISGPASPIIEGLFYAIRSTYQLKDR